MLKFLIAILLTALLGFAAPLFLPWWSFALTSLVVALAIHQPAWRAFAAGFFGLFLLWGIMTAYIDSANDHILSTKIAALLKAGSPLILVLVTALIGGLVSGFAALTGSLARRKNYSNK